MKKNWLLGISLALVLAIVGLCGCATSGQVNLVNQQEGIHITGKGEVMVVPDIATLKLGIAAQAETVAEAQSQAKETMNRIMDTLIDNGVAEKDIQTQYFNIRQVTKWHWENEEEIVVGYRVTNKVTAKIRDVDKAGAIIDAVAEAGGDLTRIDSISFSVDDPSSYHKEAREKAMADAKAKAEQLAELAGVTLGKPTYISEDFWIPPITRDIYKGEGTPVVETPITPGEMEISLTVQVIYAILD